MDIYYTISTNGLTSTVLTGCPAATRRHRRFSTLLPDVEAAVATKRCTATLTTTLFAATYVSDIACRRTSLRRTSLRRSPRETAVLSTILSSVAFPTLLVVLLSSTRPRHTPDHSNATNTTHRTP